MEERMNTQKAEYATDIARLAEDMSRRENRLTTTLILVAGIVTTILGLALPDNRPTYYLITPPTIETPTQPPP